MRVSTIRNQNFKGIPIADVSIFSKNITKKAKLFELTQNDNEFVKELWENMDVSELLPGLANYKYALWDEIIRRGLKLESLKESLSILEVQDNTPCGVLNYTKIKDSHHLSYIATWPIKKGKKAPFAGKVLLKEFFERFVKSDSNRIYLEAIYNGPFDCVSKYLELGFKSIGGDEFLENMVLTKENALKSIKKLEENISSVKIKNSKDEDLFKFLKPKWI